MTATLTGIVLAGVPDGEADAVRRIQATIDAVSEHSAYLREQFVLAAEDVGPEPATGAVSEGSEVELSAVEISDESLGLALADGAPIDLHVVIDAPEDVLLPLMIEIDLFSDEPRVDVVTEDVGLDARGMLLALVSVWGARVGYHIDDELMGVSADYVVPVGRLTWLDEDHHYALSVSDVPTVEEICGGWLFTLPHSLGDPACVEDARLIVEAADD